MKGLDKVMKDFSERGQQAQIKADRVTETYARKMANEAGSNAPVLTGALRANIISSPRRMGQAQWEFGGTLPYARLQEYENMTRKGFIRQSVWSNSNYYKDALRREVFKK